MCNASAALGHHSSPHTPHTSLVRVDPAPSPPASPADQIRGDVPTQGGGKLACDTRPFLRPSTHPPAGFFTDPPALFPTCRSSERRHTLARLGPELLCLDVCFVKQPQGKAEFSEGSGELRGVHRRCFSDEITCNISLGTAEQTSMQAAL